MSHEPTLRRYIIYMDSRAPIPRPPRPNDFHHCDDPGEFAAKPAIWTQGYCEDFVMDRKL